jgi:hypothetical protein
MMIIWTVVFGLWQGAFLYAVINILKKEVVGC